MTRKSKPLAASWLILPALTFTLCLMAFALIYTFTISLTGWDLEAGHSGLVGLGNYASVLHDGRFWAAMARTLAYASIAASSETLLGLVLAWLLTRSRAHAVLIPALMIPIIVPPVAAGLAWRRIFASGNSGLLNYALGLVGLPAHNWLGSAQTALSAVLLTDLWTWTPLFALLAFAGSASIDPSVVEAARLDGANSFQVARWVVLPQLMPLVGAALALRLVDASKTFDQIYILTGGAGPNHATELATVYIYKMSFIDFRIGYGSSSTAIFFLSILFLVLFIAVMFRTMRGRL